MSDQKKIVYCSLGSQSYCYDNGRAFFLRVMNAFEDLEGYQLILSIGGNPAAEDLLSAHGDMIVIRYAPQLDILGRATLMITHGGLNSIKECIYLGVPMLVFPGLYDQFDNAARVLYHGLGYVGHMTRTASKEIRAMVLSIKNSSSKHRKYLDLKPRPADHRVALSADPVKSNHGACSRWESWDGGGPPVAQSSSSTVCTTGTSTPRPICSMQPILPAAISWG